MMNMIFMIGEWSPTFAYIIIQGMMPSRLPVPIISPKITRQVTHFNFSIIQHDKIGRIAVEVIICSFVSLGIMHRQTFVFLPRSYQFSRTASRRSRCRNRGPPLVLFLSVDRLIRYPHDHPIAQEFPQYRT